jgi:hypothetical protein
MYAHKHAYVDDACRYTRINKMIWLDIYMQIHSCMYIANKRNHVRASKR